MFKIVRNHITVQNKIDTEITKATDVIVTERNHNDKKICFTVNNSILTHIKYAIINLSILPVYSISQFCRVYQKYFC